MLAGVVGKQRRVTRSSNSSTVARGMLAHGLLLLFRWRTIWWRRLLLRLLLCGRLLTPTLLELFRWRTRWCRRLLLWGRPKRKPGLGSALLQWASWQLLWGRPKRKPGLGSALLL